MSPQIPMPVTEFDPLIVSSPTIRSGTTLVQRLLCSAHNTLVYGETCGQDLELFLNLARSKALVYGHNKPQFEAGLRRMQAGEVNDWILDLMPEIDPYVQALTTGAFVGLAYCRDFAAEMGRPLWGFKYPGWPPPTLNLLRQTMPRSKWVYVYRDIEACLQSAKAWGEIRDVSEARTFCRAWAENLRFARTWAGDPNVLLLDFADLVRAPDESLRQIAAFSGADGTDATVFDHKINDRVSYVPPASLSEEQRFVSEARTALGEGNVNFNSRFTS